MSKTIKVAACLVIISILFACIPSDQDKEMKPFVMDWRNNADSLIDLSFLYDGPAGKDGPITIRDGHLVKPDGERFRIWGVNISRTACFPSKDQAATMAAYLARFGINCVRFVFFDYGGPASIFGLDADNTRSLDPGQLDKLDYFIAQLKQRGIYTNLGLNNARIFRRGDGVKDYEYLGIAKILSYFDPHIQTLRKEYTSQLLSHYNPYTKSRYSQEPAILSIELLNEDSIIDAWTGGRLDGTNTTKHQSIWRDDQSWYEDVWGLIWVDITSGYARQLTELYNEWLQKNLTPEELAELRRLCGVGTDEPVPGC